MTESILPKVEPSANGQHVPPEAPDPLDVNRLRLSQDFSASRPKRAFSKIPVCKPRPQWFIRVHPDPTYRLETMVFQSDDDMDRESYVVDPSLHDEFLGISGYGQRAIFTAITKQGTPFLWPIKLPDPDGRPNGWNESAVDCAGKAMRTWLRVQANMQLGAYETYEAQRELPEPTWPDLSFQELIRLAFRNRLINSIDHPILKKLRGEI